MVRKYRRKTDRVSWTQEEVTSAIEAMNNGTSCVLASIQFGVPRSTLQLKWKGSKNRKPTVDNETLGRPYALPQEHEQSLAEMLKTMGKWGFGLGKHDVLNVVQEYVVANDVKTNFKQNRPGSDWFKSFCQRYGLSLKMPELLGSSRSRQSNDPFIVYDFFKQLSGTIRELGLEQLPGQIFNCDKSGFRSDPTTSKIVSARGEAAKRVTGGNARKTTTVLACVSAAGKKLPPLVLHKGKKMWSSMIGDNAFPGTSYSVSENGWMTEAVFFVWFTEHFLPNVTEPPVLLIYDGHSSHVGTKLIGSAIDNQIRILKLPPHTSHILQPLDVSVFKGVKSKWDEMLAEWARHNYGKVLPKSVFSNILGKVWSNVSEDVIKKGFEKCGIFDKNVEFPVNPAKMKESSFDPAKLRRYKLQNGTITSNVAVKVTSPDQLTTAIIMSPQQLTPALPRVLTEQIAPNRINFENLLLKTVSPASSDGPPKRKRIDNAEIISKELYLRKLENVAMAKKVKVSPKPKVTKNKLPPKENRAYVKKRDRRCVF